MKSLLTFALVLFSWVVSVAQQAGGNQPPKAFGPVKTITYKYHSVTFSRDKTRIDEGVSNGRNIVWLFNSSGKPLSSEIFEKDGRPSGSKSLYTYDTGGRVKTIVHYLLGSLSYTESFAYPKELQVKITRVFEAKPLKSTVIELDEYDKAGNIIKATFQSDDGIQTETYKYDDRGNPTEFVVTDESGKTWDKETYRYEFDSYGNWTKKSSESVADPSTGIPPKSTQSRQITYY